MYILFSFQDTFSNWICIPILLNSPLNNFLNFELLLCCVLGTMILKVCGYQWCQVQSYLLSLPVPQWIEIISEGKILTFIFIVFLSFRKIVFKKTSCFGFCTVKSTQTNIFLLNYQLQQKHNLSKLLNKLEFFIKKLFIYEL